MADVKWIKITPNFFNDEKIVLIDSMPNSDTVIVIWLKLLCLASRLDNGGRLATSDGKKYTIRMLSETFGRKEAIVRMALDAFERFCMIENIDGVITVTNWKQYQDRGERYGAFI